MKEDLNEYQKKILILEEELKKYINTRKRKFAKSTIDRQEILINEINSLKELVFTDYLENSNEFRIELNDIVKIKFLDDDYESLIKLVSNNSNNMDILEVEINTPLGLAIYGKKVDDVVEYDVNKEKLKIKIEEIKKENSKILEKKYYRVF